MGNVFDKDGNELKTLIALHPGEFLQEEVEERGLKKSELAFKLGILPGHLSELFKGKRNITARIAVRLEKALDISAEYWLGLQSSFDLIHARQLEQAS
ncbi:MAG: HigA family addiction module antitoxin [Bacteroidota bacterium]